MNTQQLPGKIEIQGEIAKGQTGTIYYGYDQEIRQEVAIKIYHSHINGRLIRGKAFIEKSKPLLRIEHPNLIKIFKVEEHDETPIVYMEFFDAPSLQQVIHTEGPLPVGKMLLLAREIAEVLVHTHFQGIIHGTLHPGHVLVGPQGQIKVMDLGLSWILMDILSNCDAELLRPLPYLPPEIAKGELLNVSSDLYCLGFMMYDMLTKRVPYSGLPKTSIMGKLAFDQTDPDFDFPDGVPEAIRELIRQMTRNKSQHRLQDATHVLTILNQQLAKFSPEISSPPAVPSEPQPIPESQSAKVEAPAPPPQTTVSAPPLNQPPAVNRPRHLTDYQGVHQANTRKKFGVTFGFFLLLLICGTMGYVYREQLDIPFLSSSQEIRVPKQPLINEPAPPVPPIDSFRTMPPEIPISPLPNISTNEEPGVKPNDTSKHNDTSNREIPTPTPPATVETEGSPLKLDASPPLGTPLPSPQERTPAQSPNSSQQTKPEPKPVPGQPNTAPPQDNSNIGIPPISKKPVTPVTPPAPKPPAIISETGQAASPTVTKESAIPSLPSALAPDRPQATQESAFPSPNTESSDNVESKEFKEILDSVQIPKTETTLSTDGPSPLRPSPPAPPSPPALSPPESSP